ncbi:hypothetical protein ABPG74_021656 [Tetrahymena malaccensis]
MNMKVFLVVLLGLSLTLCLKQDEVLAKYKVEVLKSGTYESYPSQGETVTVHYTGTFLDGKKFDSSKDRNQPFQFQVGRGRVIKCWDEVVARLTLGDHVIVTCPSETAYGKNGAGSVIPPNSDLKFEIEMLGFGTHKVSDL